MRIPFIDALKGLAIVGVIFVHMGFASRFDSGTLADVRMLQKIFGWCVLAFFFASGCLHLGGSATEQNWETFTLRRARRLLVPCAAFSWAYKALLLGAKAAGFIAATDAPALRTPADIAAFAFVPVAPQFYFLVHLFCIAVAVHPVLRLRWFRHPCTPWMIAAALLQSYWLLPLDLPHGEALTQLPLYAASYLAGIGFTRSVQAEKLRGFRPASGMLLFIVAVAAASAARPQVLHSLVPPLLAAFAMLLPLRAFAPAALLGLHSGAVYVWHAPIIMPVISILLTKLPLNGWLLITGMTVLTLGTALVLESLVRRFDTRGFFRL